MENAKEILNNVLGDMDFTCEYSSNLPEIFKRLNISLAFTSYQAGRLMFVRSDGESLDVNYKSFHRPMGLSATENGLTLGVFTQVINFRRQDALVEKLKAPLQKIEEDITAPRLRNDGKDEDGRAPADYSDGDNALLAAADGRKDQEDDAREKHIQEIKAYEEKLHEPVDERVDACYITRSSHYTGMINIHDIDWGDEGLWVVNSSFSCLCTLDPDYSFVPRWKPYFISDLVPEDRCHLNGMTLKDGKPAYVTTFSTFDEPSFWRKGKKLSGTLMDVERNEILVDDLFMPHSPRWHMGKVFFCNSGCGEFCSYEPFSGNRKTLAQFRGFTRGVDFYGPIAFIGLSRARRGNVISTAPLMEKYEETYSGIWLINLNDNSEVGYIRFTGNVEQIYDVAVIPGCTFPELLEPTHPRMRNHFFIP